MMKKIINFLNKHERLLLWLGIAAYFIIFSLICIFKYCHFGYNGLDLAIYNQVFYNSVHGQLFGMTIHPNSYLGDHFELLILLLLPIYAIFKHPISLLILQSLILALSAWPLFLIAKNILAKPSATLQDKAALDKPWPLLIALLWLLNPFIQNINLFEFHILPFAIFFLLFTFYFYQQNRFLAFLLFAFCSLLVREDVALVIFMFSVLALIDKKTKKWIIWPGVISVIWFILAIKIIGHFTPAGSYKFLYYYSWLGTAPLNMAVNFFLKPLNSLQHIFTLNNVLFTLLLFLPFGYLNLISRRYLLLALPAYLQIMLGGGGNSTIVLKIHYTALLLPGLFIALIYSLKKLHLKENDKIKLVRFSQKYQGLALIILLVSAIYGALTMGPLATVAKSLFQPAYNAEVGELKNQLLKTVPGNASIAATYELLTNLSSRSKVYSLHYAFVGIKEFSQLDYRLPNDVEALLVDFDDFLTYGLQFPNSQRWQNYYREGDNNLRELILEQNFRVAKIIDSLALFQKNGAKQIELYKTAGRFNDIEHQSLVKLPNGLEFLGWSTPANLNPVEESLPSVKLLPLSLYFNAKIKIADDYQLKLLVKNKNGQIVHSKLYPLAYGLYPTSEWQPGEAIKINYWFLLPQTLPSGEYQIELALTNLQGFLTLNGLRSAVIKITQQESLQPMIGLITVLID